MLENRSAAMSRLSKLPPFHPTALRLLNVSASNDSAVSEFEKVFQGDPALASHLLKVANSSMYGFRNRIDSIRHAIALIGLEGVRALSFTIAIGSYVRGAETTAAVRTVWDHSLATAVIAEVMGAAVGQDLPYLYTAGLLHDVGRLGMLGIEGSRYAEVLLRRYFDIEECLLLEDLLLGCGHDEAGAFLARSWGFPQHLCDCIRYHHHPDISEKESQTNQIVRFACYTANSLGMAEVVCEGYQPAAVDTALMASVLSSPSMNSERLLARITGVIDSLVASNANPEACDRNYGARRRVS